MKTKNILQGCAIAGTICIGFNCTNVNAQALWQANGPYITYSFRSVGIKTDSPTNDFHVNGSFRTRSAFVDSVANIWRLLVAEALSVGGNLSVDGNSQFNGLVSIGSTLNLNGANASISSTTGTVDFLNSGLTTTGNISADSIVASYIYTSKIHSTAIHSTSINSTTLQSDTGRFTWLNANALLQNGNPLVSSQWISSGSDIFYNSGKVGVGTAAPSTNLEVSHSGPVEIKANSTGQWAGYSLQTGSSQTNYLWQEFNENKLRFWVNNADRMVIDDSGKVGIGVVNPSFPLHVVGDAAITGTVYADQLAAQSHISIGQFRFINGAAQPGQADTIRTSAALQIQAVETMQLTTAEALKMRAESTVEITSVSDTIKLAAGTVVVGPGGGPAPPPPISPVALDVVGDVRASGSIRANSLDVSGATTFGSLLKVQNKITVGDSTLILEDNPSLGILNSIYTTDDALFIQSNPDNSFNTIINAGNGLNPGFLGIGTDDPRKMLHVFTVHEVGGVPLPPRIPVSFPGGGGSHYGIRLEDHTASNIGTTISVWDIEPKGSNLIIGTPGDPMMTLSGTGTYIFHGLADLTPPIVQFRPVVVDPVGKFVVLPSSGPFLSATFDSLRVNHIIRVGSSSLVLDGSTTQTGPANSIYSSGGDLKIQSTGTGFNTIISKDENSLVGIGTINPTAKLHLDGTFKYVDGNQADGFILKSDAGGNASWANPATISDGDWTRPGGDKMHTTNLNDNVGIGLTNPAKKLHIYTEHVGGFEGEGEEEPPITGSHHGIRVEDAFFTQLNPQTPKNFVSSSVWDIEPDGKTGKLHIGNETDTVMTLTEDGNVGISNNNPGHNLSIHSTTLPDPETPESVGSLQITNLNTGNTANDGLIIEMCNENARIRNIEAFSGFGSMDFLASSFNFQIPAATGVTISNNGKVGIGTTNMPGNYKLYVKDGILAENVKSAVHGTGDWMDHKLQKDYKQMGIYELEDYIKNEGHVPGVPTAEEVVKNGVEMVPMFSALLGTSEDLILYTIQQQKEIDALKKEMNQLKKEIKKLKKEINK